MAEGATKEQDMRRRVRHTFSAGGIVLRDTMFGPDIVLVRRFAQGLWALPKGTPIAEETPAQTARREVEEETGLVVEVDRFAGSIQYQFTRDGVLFRKTVNFYLMHAVGGDFTRHDSEYDAVEWVPVDRALEQMTYSSEASLLRHILARPAPHAGKPERGSGRAAPPAQGAERAG
jgi:8-oxo-dGTP pyrophosphatase MutT (NUDIX family)